MRNNFIVSELELKMFWYYRVQVFDLITYKSIALSNVSQPESGLYEFSI